MVGDLIPTTQLTLPSHIVFREIGGVIYILPTAKEQRVLKLENLAAYIWSCLDRAPTVQQVKNQVAAFYPKTPVQRIHSDTIALIQQLMTLGLVITSNEYELKQTSSYQQVLQPQDELFLWQQAATFNVPLKTEIEVSQSCNLACYYCYVKSARQNVMSTRQIESLLDDLAQLGCLFLGFTGGEPFLRKDLLDLVHYAHTKRFLIRILTNGTLVDHNVSKQLSQFPNLVMSMSIHGQNPETHDAFTQRTGSFRAMIQAVEYLRAENVPVQLKLAVTKANFAQVDAIRLFVDRLGCKFAMSTLIYPRIDGDTRTTAWRISQAQLIQLMRRGLVASESVRCLAGKAKCWIGPAGDVHPCEFLRQSMGNVTEELFSTIWHSERLSAFRSQPILPPSKCQKCQHQPYCTWCPGIAYLEHGSYAAVPRESCRTARAWAKVQAEMVSERYG